MPKKVLIAFDDPGGGLAVGSLIGRLTEEKNLRLEIYSGRLSENFLIERKIEFTKIESMISKSAAEEIIDKNTPDILITGTGGGNAEQEFRNAAYERNIASVVILDFWKDYSRRWLYASYPVEKMNDKICVMDELTKNELIEEKFPAEHLIVTGHPYLDKLFNYGKILNNDTTEFIDDCERRSSELKKILFLSQPLEIIGIENYKVHPVKILLDVLSKLSLKNKKKLSLIIKLHPAEEKTAELDSLVSLNNSDKIEISFAGKNKSLEALIRECDAVIGYNTIAMFESRAMKKRTISLNVVPVRDSLTKAMETAGIDIVRADETEVYKCLINKDSEKVNLNQNIFKGGIDNCVEVILNELNCK